MQCLRVQPLQPKCRRQRRGTFQQLVCPNPRQTAKRNLKTAGPIDAYGVRIFRVPVPPLPENFVRVAPIVRQSIRLGQGYQVLMTIQFPYDFAIADLIEVEIVDPMERLLRGRFAIYQIAMPGNGVSIVQVFMAEQIEFMAHDFVSLLNDQVSLLGKALTKQAQQIANRFRAEEKPTSFCLACSNQARSEVVPEARENGVGTLGYRLSAAIEEFVRVHLPQARQGVPPTSTKGSQSRPPQDALESQIHHSRSDLIEPGTRGNRGGRNL